MSDSDGLFDTLESVCDEATFLKFLDLIAADFALERRMELETPSPPYGPGALGWENNTIDHYFYAAASWGRSWKNQNVQNIWRRCAEILYAGKIYE